MKTLQTELAPVEEAGSEHISILPAGRRIAMPRTLFQNGFVTIMSVELRRGQRLRFLRPGMRLLTVERGGLRMWGPHGSFELGAAGRWPLGEGEHWKIRAMTDSSVSVFVAAPEAIRREWSIKRAGERDAFPANHL